MIINTNLWNKIRYTLYAPFYDLTVSRFESSRKRSIDLLRLSAGQHVLIIGAGTGSDLPYFPAEVEITAIDFTPAMVDHTQRRACSLGRQVRCKVMDGQALDFPSAIFDAVVLHLILAVIPDPIACIHEAVRVLKANGQIAIFDKFLPEGESPSIGRRVLNGITTVLFSDINRTLGPILATVPVKVVHQETVGAYRAVGYGITLVRKEE